MSTGRGAWELGVPRTIDGEEYVLIRFDEGAYSYDRDEDAMRAAGFGTVCAGCPYAETPHCNSRAYPCESNRDDVFVGWDAANRQRIVPLRIVPLLALQGVLE